MREVRIICLMIVVSVLAGCTKFDGDVKVPAYIHLDRMGVEKRAGSGAQDGFITSAIDAVQLVAYWEGDESETELGTFQLPCTVPVLRKDTITRLRITPVVKQNGIAATRIEYPYYEYVTLEKVNIASDSTTNLGAKDSLGEWFINTTYRPWTTNLSITSDTLLKVLAQEYFEDIQFTISFSDKVTRLTNDPIVRTGTGCGIVVVPDSSNRSVDFEIENEIECNDPTAYLYLEMDYKTDVRLSVGMRSAYYDGGTEDTQSAVTLYATQEWKKIYINLGRLWSQFNHHAKFHVVFSALNSDGTGGKVYLDNVKLLQM